MQETEDIVNAPTVPDDVLAHIHAYGDERADDSPTAHLHLLEAILSIRRWGATLRAEVASLKTVMVAAAEEISAHWQAHCDAEGYGPQNLVRRLEEGIPSEYGYTAGAFAALRAEAEGLRADAERLDWLEGEYERERQAILNHRPMPDSLFRRNMPITRAAIDAAKADKEGA